MLELARDIIGTQPILTAFLAIGLGYLVGQISVGGFSLGVGAVLFVGLAHRRIRSQGADHRPDRSHRPDHVLVRDRHSLRTAVLRRYARSRAQIQSARVGCVRGGAVRRARAWTGLRHQDRAYARNLRWIDDQYCHAAGCARRHEKQGSLDRILDRVSLRCDRSDPVHLFHDARSCKPKFPPKAQHFHMGESDACGRLRRSHAR